MRREVGKHGEEFEPCLDATGAGAKAVDGCLAGLGEAE
jgi:hypothetical protein